ncbi:MAG TPA: hypothetical protein PLY06_01130 [Anaerolineaceae bacterium]|jgi:uncharacterized membrane protein YvlD (DUF360 family)|nr:hypothetical protein [Anaerolineaceae bacterium]HOF27938.1 hypothetical protein [Anaerolineaceae bacterium]
MKLNPPTKLAFLISVAAFVLGLLFQFVKPLAALVPSFPLGVFLLIAAFVVLALANLLKNF